MNVLFLVLHFSILSVFTSDGGEQRVRAGGDRMEFRHISAEKKPWVWESHEIAMEAVFGSWALFSWHKWSRLTQVNMVLQPDQIPGRHSVGSTRWSESSIPRTGLPSCFILAGFKGMAVKSQVLRDRWLPKPMTNTFLKAWKFTLLGERKEAFIPTNILWDVYWPFFAHGPGPALGSKSSCKQQCKPHISEFCVPQRTPRK